MHHMSFSEALLRVRGQLAFLLALVCSTAVIIYLEALDAEARIRDQVVAQVAVTGEIPDQSRVLSQSARDALELARSDFERDPEVPLHQAAILNAVVLATANGVDTADALRGDAGRVLAMLEQGSGQQVRMLAPALGLLATAVPELEPRVLALLNARAGVFE